MILNECNLFPRNIGSNPPYATLRGSCAIAHDCGNLPEVMQ
jgi:hypothetical protein